MDDGKGVQVTLNTIVPGGSGMTGSTYRVMGT